MKLPLARPDDEIDRTSFRWLIDLDKGCLLSKSKVRQMTADDREQRCGT